MSYAEDMGYDGYDGAAEYEPDELFHATKNGTEVCANCGSKNIKTSKKGNKYCAELCWVKDSKAKAEK